MPKSKIPKEAIDLTLATLAIPSLHWKACYLDISNRPQPLDCICPLRYAIDKVLKLKSEWFYKPSKKKEK